MVQRSPDGALQWVGQALDNRVGNNSGKDGQFIFVFELPTIAVGETVTSASLDAHLISIQLFTGNTIGDIDVYGIGSRDASTVLASDYFDVTSPGTNVLVHESLATSTTAAGTVSTSDSTTLGEYIQGLYDAGAEAGDYVFLSLVDESPATTTPSRYYRFASADAATESQRPTLTITTSAVPEPGSLVVASLGALLMLKRQP